ncbi:MAG: serine/threonine-protein kinase, partial [Planctomycetota bacterium]|nr:serine/threonine-protein kinase [Planctomycetota bacterium]
PTLDSTLDQAATSTFQQLSDVYRQQLTQSLLQLKTLAGPQREEQGRLLISNVGQFFLNSIPFRNIAASFARPANASGSSIGRRMTEEIQLANDLVKNRSVSHAESPQECLKVEAIEGPHKGEEWTFYGRTLIFIGRGRHPGDRDQVVLNEDKTVSRNHCLIEFNPPECLLRDLSKNGVVLDNQRLQGSGLIKDKSQLRLGYTVLQAHYVAPKPDQDAVELECMECGRVFFHGSKDQTMEINRPICANCLGKTDFQSQPFPGLELLSELGEGDLGKVYLARQSHRSELVAVKTMRPSLAIEPRKMAIFLAEAKRGAAFNHPNSIRLFDGGFAAGFFYFLLEYMNGVDAKTAIEHREHPYSWPDTLSIFVQVSRAIEAAHRQGLVHRDIKPGNILLSQGANGKQVAKINDFGLLKSFEDTGLSYLTRSGAEHKPPAYMAPEQILNKMPAGPQADIYSLGATFYYLLTGRRPLDFSKGHFTIVIMEHEPLPLKSPLPDIPEGIEAIVMRCMHKDPTKRFTTVTELLFELDAVTNQ